MMKLVHWSGVGCDIAIGGWLKIGKAEVCQLAGLCMEAREKSRMFFILELWVHVQKWIILRLRIYSNIAWKDTISGEAILKFKGPDVGILLHSLHPSPYYRPLFQFKGTDVELPILDSRAWSLSRQRWLLRQHSSVQHSNCVIISIMCVILHISCRLCMILSFVLYFLN